MFKIEYKMCIILNIINFCMAMNDLCFCPVHVASINAWNIMCKRLEIV